MKVSEVVRLNETAEFASDVQLRWYAEDGPKNLALVRRYVFTRTSAGERKSPVDILYQIKQASLLDTYENRFVVIATFGHGKTHLALALANFFGKRPESEEVDAVLNNIHFAFGDEPEAESYREFKQGRKRHLVVCLDGTKPDDLPHLFLSALQKALRNEPETAKASLPFWTEEALRIVQRIESRDAERGRANEFLRSHELDVASLKARLESQDVSVYDTVRSLCQHLSGFMPDMGGQVSLAHAVEWAADTFCGEGDDKPFSGVLVLFDEFSAFMRSYSIRGTAGNPLQKLLDGVSNRQGKVVFVAFGQSDPDATVRSVFHQTPNEQGRASLLLELQRLPPRFRFLLYTTMESVLDSYLDQDSAELRGAFDRDSVWPAILDATDDCLTLFKKRYEQELGWNSEKFQEVVTLGAFPLHPTTTALLCNVELLDSPNPRSVLGFVFKQLEGLADQPVTAGGSPCWIRAVHLVDWFKDQLADDEWKQYEEALRQRGGDLAPHEGLVLKAMLLHVVSKMPTQQVPFAHALVHLTGLTQAEVEAALKKLADATVIEHVSTAKKYIFWPLGGGARLLHDHINREIAGRSMTWDEWKRANASPAEFDLPAIQVSVAWGHPDDWEARQWYLPREFASAAKVKEIVSDSPGCVIWLVAKNDADVDWFDQNGDQILSALGNTAPLPVAVMCPSRPSPLLLEGMFKHVVLESLTGSEIVQFGGGIVQTVKTQVKSAIVNETRLLPTTKKRYGVPLPYAASLKAAPPPDRMESIVQRLYELAYPSAPPAFFTHLKARSTNLKSAVSHLSALLLQNQVNSRTYEANKVAVGTVDNFLVVGKPGSWGVLSPDKRLQLPQSQRTTTGWDLLSQSVLPGTEAEIRPTVLRLRQPPFGYDDNTLTLLFCAWYGYHRHDLRLSIKGAINTVEFLVEKVKAGPGDLVEFLSAGGVRLSRKDRAGTVGEVKKIIERATRLAAEPMSKAEASAATVKLAEFLNDERNQDPSEREMAKEAGEIIGGALKRADAYDTEVRSILEAAREQVDFTDLLDSAKRAGEVESVREVVPEQPPVSEVREVVLKRLGESVEAFCKQNEALSDITHHKHQHDQLTRAGRAVHAHVELYARIRQALERLETAKAEYEDKQKDAARLETLRVIGTRGPLQQLRGGLESVNGARCVSSEARAVQAAKKAGLKQAIEEHERFAADIGAKVDAIASAGALATVESSITERRWAFEDAPEMAQITVAFDRCAALRCFFEDLHATGHDTFGTRKEHEACVKALRELKVNHAGCLSGPREARIVDAEEKAQSRVRELEKDAEAWLAKMQSRSNEAEDLNRLLDELSHPPDFLPAARAAEVQGLVSKLRELISKDAYGQIRALFLRIRDKGLRKRLIEELRTLLTADGE